MASSAITDGPGDDRRAALRPSGLPSADRLGGRVTEALSRYDASSQILYDPEL